MPRKLKSRIYKTGEGTKVFLGKVMCSGEGRDGVGDGGRFGEGRRAVGDSQADGGGRRRGIMIRTITDV